MVPTEEDVGVGAARADVGQHAGVGDDGPGRVGLLEGAFDRTVQHRLVEAGQLLGREVSQGIDVVARARLDVEGHRLVVAAPHADARMVAQQADRLAGLAHRLLAHAAGVAPLQRQVLPEQQSVAVGRVVQLGPRHMTVDP